MMQVLMRCILGQEFRLKIMYAYICICTYIYLLIHMEGDVSVTSEQQM